MIYKVDFEKAFDSLRWDFLYLVMAKLGFGIRWRNWMKGCLQHARSSMLVNGPSTVEFEISRGLRQGNPLSPFLFILAMESLHALICKAMNLNQLCVITKMLFSLYYPLCYAYVDSDLICFISFTDEWVHLKDCRADITLKLKIEVVLVSVAVGGLGIGSIFALNVGLLFKWIWRFMQNSSDLWARVIKAIYGHNGGIHTDSTRSSNQALCIAESRIGAKSEDSSMHLQLQGNQLVTSIRFPAQKTREVVLKPLNYRVCKTLLEMCYLISVTPGYGRLISPKDTQLLLLSAGIDVDSLLCPICNEDVETVNHLFFSCDMAKDLWALLAR
ncbi:RNA-directed DNA polymerase, eukaryota, reverse transcriptase zinc-binding domain protein [Tanacetum coccineum]